jgi:class 3 adenylate cyclase
MITCSACGGESPDGFKFCGLCGAPLAAPSPIADERKVVTTLFCDLVGSTAMGEVADPEDVDALLRRYNDLARRIVESHGGTVEKFIGDAVVAVFGVPVVHEDDPERAVRAGLRLVEAVEDLAPVAGHPVQVRVGVNTGEAFVRLDVTPGSGETFLTGDAVNVGARLQSAAPPMGVVVGATTHELTQKAIAYEPLEPVAAKGKGEPLAAWLATSPVARTGAHAFERTTPFVGRTVELSFLGALLDKAADTASPQIALVVGEPGIGKSRLVAELFADVDSSSRLVTWRQGHCLPYGEGVTFWALAEIVKAHAGILETDAREAVESKLEAVLPEGEDRPWFRERLRALLGLEAASADRDENFTAWLRFLEDLASRHVTVLVIEDLHWADDALLAFVEHVATHVADVPLFLVATARPELFERHPAFASSSRVNRLAVQRLSTGETERLVDSLLRETADGVRDTIVRHSEGNPFYAEESARVMADRIETAAATSPGRATEADGRATVAPTIQAVIAARLDTLPADLKALLADASVVGETFWDGALAAAGDRPADEVDAGLHALIERQLVHRVRTSSMAGEREFAFGHALARDVAYNELPRAVRTKKHAAVAGWIEQKAGDRAEDLAEILAHHYATAHELARAAGETALAHDLVEPAVRCLELAGDRASPLDVAATERYYARALEAGGSDDPRRSTLLVKWAKAATELGRGAEAIGPLEEAIERLLAGGDVHAAAVARMALARVLPRDGSARWLELADEAVASLEADGPSRELVAVLTDWLRMTLELGDYGAQLAAVQRAIDLSQQLGIPVDARLIALRGCARCDLGLAGGDEDLKQALEMCRSSGPGECASQVLNYVSNWTYIYEGFSRSLAICAEAMNVARRRGEIDLEAELRGVIVWACQAGGDWDRVLEEAAAMDPLLGTPVVRDPWTWGVVRSLRTLVLVERGLAREGATFLDWLEERARERPSDGAACSIAAAATRMALGDRVRALEILSLGEATLRGKGGYWLAWLLPDAVRLALAAGDRTLAEGLAGSLEPVQPIARHALVAAQALVTEANGDYERAAAGFADAAARWRDFAAVYEEAHALFGQGRCLVALGRAPEAAPVLEQARTVFARLEAAPALADIEALIARVRP